MLVDALDISFAEINDAKVDDDISLSSYCTVFAESEVISLRSDGYSEAAISSAVNRSFANKVAGQAKSLYTADDTVVVTGGMALNNAFVEFLQEELETELAVSESPQTSCAYRRRAARTPAEVD